MVGHSRVLLLFSLQALLELEMNSDLKAQLRELNITAAKVRWLTGVLCISLFVYTNHQELFLLLVIFIFKIQLKLLF